MRMATRPPGGHAVLQQPAGELGEVFREDHSVLEADAGPERHPHDEPLTIVEIILDHHLHADHEQQWTAAR